MKALQHAQARLKLANQAHSRTKTGSVGRAKAARRLGKVHGRVAAVRKTPLHSISAELTRGNTTVVIEDLNAAGMHHRHKRPPDARTASAPGWAGKEPTATSHHEGALGRNRDKTHRQAAAGARTATKNPPGAEVKGSRCSE